jgi:hypothetical protein
MNRKYLFNIIGLQQNIHLVTQSLQRKIGYYYKDYQEVNKILFLQERILKATEAQGYKEYQFCVYEK